MKPIQHDQIILLEDFRFRHDRQLSRCLMRFLRRPNDFVVTLSSHHNQSITYEVNFLSASESTRAVLVAKKSSVLLIP